MSKKFYLTYIPELKDTQDVLLEKAKGNTKYIFEMLSQIDGMTDEIKVVCLCAGIRLGVMGNGKMTSVQRVVVEDYLVWLIGSNDAVFSQWVDVPIDEFCFKTLSNMYSLTADGSVGKAFYNFILCFSYIEGSYRLISSVSFCLRYGSLTC